jgi:hypothetical protein
VPVLLLTGEAQTIAEGTALLGDVETVVVKTGIDRYPLPPPDGRPRADPRICHAGHSPTGTGATIRDRASDHADDPVRIHDYGGGGRLPAWDAGGWTPDRLVHDESPSGAPRDLRGLSLLACQVSDAVYG